MKVKKITSMTLALILVLSLLPAFAAKPTNEGTIKDIDGKIYTFGYYESKLNPGVTTSKPGGMNYRYINDVPSYCIEVGLNNGDLTEFLNAIDSDAMKAIESRENGDIQTELIYRILLYGYREHNGTAIFLQEELSDTPYSKGAAYAATQLLIWEVAEGLRSLPTGSASESFLEG